MWIADLGLVGSAGRSVSVCSGPTAATVWMSFLGARKKWLMYAVDDRRIHSSCSSFWDSSGRGMRTAGLPVHPQRLLAGCLHPVVLGSIYGWVFEGDDWLIKLTPVGGIGFFISWLLLGFQYKTIIKGKPWERITS